LFPRRRISRIPGFACGFDGVDAHGRIGSAHALEIVAGGTGSGHAANFSMSKTRDAHYRGRREITKNPSPSTWLRRRNLYPLFARNKFVRPARIAALFAGTQQNPTASPVAAWHTTRAAAEFGWRATTRLFATRLRKKRLRGYEKLGASASGAGA